MSAWDIACQHELASLLSWDDRLRFTCSGKAALSAPRPEVECLVYTPGRRIPRPPRDAEVYVLIHKIRKMDRFRHLHALQWYSCAVFNISLDYPLPDAFFFLVTTGPPILEIYMNDLNTFSLGSFLLKLWRWIDRSQNISNPRCLPRKKISLLATTYCGLESCLELVEGKRRLGWVLDLPCASKLSIEVNVGEDGDRRQVFFLSKDQVDFTDDDEGSGMYDATDDEVTDIVDVRSQAGETDSEDCITVDSSDDEDIL